MRRLSNMATISFCIFMRQEGATPISQGDFCIVNKLLRKKFQDVNMTSSRSFILNSVMLIYHLYIILSHIFAKNNIIFCCCIWWMIILINTTNAVEKQLFACRKLMLLFFIRTVFKVIVMEWVTILLQIIWYLWL